MAGVKVTGITETITEQQLREFFSYSGEVSSVELFNEALGGRSAIVRFAEEGALETALLLTGATIVSGDPPVTVTALDASQLAVPLPTSAGAPGLGELSSGQVPHNDESGSQQVVERAQKMVGLLMERGYVLGVDAVQRAKDLDERAGLSVRAKEMSEQLKLKERMEAAAVAAKPVIDVTKQFASDGLAVTKDAAQQAVAKARELNEKYQIVDKSKEAATAAVTKARELNEQYKVTETAKNAVTSVMQNETVASSITCATAPDDATYRLSLLYCPVIV